MRTFAGEWKPLGASLDVGKRFYLLPSLTLDQFAFLSDNTIVGISGNREDPDTHIDVLQTDGARVSSPILPWLEPNTSLTGPVVASQDGRYFAVGFSHRTWLSHLLLDIWKLDDTPSNDELVLVVWACYEPNAVAKFNLGDELGVRGLSLLPGDAPSLVYLGKSSLKVLPIQPDKTTLALGMR